MSHYIANATTEPEEHEAGALTADSDFPTITVTDEAISIGARCLCEENLPDVIDTWATGIVKRMFKCILEDNSNKNQPIDSLSPQ